MPNPYDDDEAKRQAQIAQLGAPPAGFSHENWTNPNMHSVKYDAGRMLAGHNKPSEIGAIVQGGDFQKRFPGATFNGKDWIDFRGALSDGDRGTPVNGIDVLMAADPEADTSNGVWWGAPDDSGPQAPAPTSHKMGVNPAADNSALGRIMAELQAAQSGKDSPAEREAMLALLQGP